MAIISNRGLSAVKSNWIWLVIFFFYLLFFSLTPLAVDDYTFLASWKSVVGIGGFIDINSYFYNHINGRIIGNLFSVALISDRLLSSIVRALAMIALVFLVKNILKIKSKEGIAMVAFLVFFVPGSIFSETIAWRAGFFNYVVPVVIFFAVFYLVQRYALYSSDKVPGYVLVLVFLLSIFGSLFVENITIAIVLALIVAIIISVQAKKRQLFYISSAGLLGSIIGSLSMFVAPAYRKVIEGEDSYRDVATHASEGLMNMLFENLFTIIHYLIAGFWPLLAALSMLALAILFFVSTKASMRIKICAAIGICLPLVYLIASDYLVYIDNLTTNTGRIFGLLKVCLALLFYLSILTVLLFSKINKNIKVRIILFIALALLLCAPFLVVSPISPRVFYFSYILQAIACFELSRVLFNKIKISKDNLAAIKIAIIVTIAAACAGILLIFGLIALREHQNNSLARSQIKQGGVTIYLKKYPAEKLLYRDKYLSAWPRMFYAECKCKYRQCDPCTKLDIIYQ